MIRSETAFVLESANWPVLLVDAAGTILASSQGAKKLFGNVLEGHPSVANSIWSPDNHISAPQFFQQFRNGSENAMELRFRGRDGGTTSFLTQLCPFAAGGDNLCLLQLFAKGSHAEPHVEIQIPSATSTDIPTLTEPASLIDPGVAHKQKLDCAMQLIRTVALDFNNALTSILGHTSLLHGRTHASHPFRGSLVQVEKSAQKAAEIAHDLADFSRQEKDPRSQQSGNLNDLVRKAIAVFRENHTGGAEWEIRLESRPYAVHFDEAKVQQALLKILENSVQAMPDGGKMTVRTWNFDADESSRDGNVRLNPGAYLCVEIVDTGTGIAPEVLPRIFEPFFTTRKESGHRGLGLAWVYGILTNHGGSVAVSSELNKGTSVRVYLPAQNKVVQDRSGDNGSDLRGSQTILMIDDEDLLLTMGEMVLSSFGYRVLTANSGLKALEIYSKRASEIDLVITDMVMPQMSGREVVERLRRVSPGVKVICASGFVRPPAGNDADSYLQKPFASQDLLRKVKQVLGAAAPA